ncbi:DinB family protein [Spirosoma soli]|uniref:DinB family protein n=1 Tax=Spirosoma soli TaxID=1770529 RepID=A0ABW5M6R6_9BACT
MLSIFMATPIEKLLNDVAQARQSYLAAVSTFTEQQAVQKPLPDSWNAVEVTEHLFWAEQGAIFGMWKTLLGIRAGTLNYEADQPHAGLPIEEIIRRTWQEKEVVPAVAAPRMGGPLAYWIAALDGLQLTLKTFGDVLTEDELVRIAHPHPISGPLSFGQRFEFLRFHIDRHRGQVERLLYSR